MVTYSRRFIGRFFFLCAVLVQALLFGEVKITVAPADDPSPEGSPIEIRVQISRSDEEKINEDSFKLGNDKIKVERLQESKQTSVTLVNGKRTENSILITTYRFFLDPKQAGIQVIPSVSVTVNGNVYRSSNITFTIEKPESSDQFQLKSEILGTQPVYPGQRITLVYTILFKKNIELTRQFLPLLDAEGLKKIGGLQTRSYTKGNYQAQEISQQVEAISPGNFSFAPSMIEGFPYEEDFFGRRSYIKPRLIAKAEGITLSVQEFPPGAPKSFQGAVGDYLMGVKMTTPKSLAVGDKIELQVTIYGTGQMENLQLPRIAEQEGFKGVFRFNDLPPSGVIQDNGKQFLVEMRPLSDQLKAIPPIEFSFFDPTARKYKTLFSDPISLSFKTLEGNSLNSFDKKSISEKAKLSMESGYKNWIKGFQLPPSSISGNYKISPQILVTDPMLSPYMLLIIPAIILLLFFQLFLRNYSDAQKAKAKEIKSYQCYVQAFRLTHDPDSFFPLIEKAFLLKLQEKGQVSADIRSPGDLSDEGLIGEVKQLLCNIEEKRYMRQDDGLVQKVAEDIRKLFGRIQ